jgi:DNA (cytosine-5)-methyltransferase 1
MNELALFAGAGGGILGGHLAGRNIVCAVERDAYAAQVLAQRQNDGILPPFPVWSDVSTFDGRRWRGIVDVISGGFPCQDISAAGPGTGLDGERSGLWSQFKRIIGEVDPDRVEVENSPMLTIRGLGIVLGDLAALGFDAEWGCISAADLDAPHLRERIWIMAYSHRLRELQPARRQQVGRLGSGQRREAVDNAERIGCAAWQHDYRRDDRQQFGAAGEHACALANADSIAGVEGRPDHATQRARGWHADRSGISADMADAMRQRQRQQGIIAGGAHAEDGEESGERQDRPCGYGFGRWPAEPGMGRVADGVANRVDRIKALGNGQVPRVVATAWEVLTPWP